MKIADLFALQRENDSIIKGVAENIHPKLLSIIGYEDIFNDEYMDNELKRLYDTVVAPKIKELNQNFYDARNQFLIDYVNDMSWILDSTGYYLDDGSDSYRFSDSIPSDYIPCIEIAPVWDAVRSMHSDYQYKPFWQNDGYMVIGNAETVRISSYNDPRTFIVENRSKFTRSYGKTNLEMMLLSLQQREDLFDYPIYVQPLSTQQDKNIPSNLTDAVRRHLVLRSALENYEEVKMYKSSISSIREDGTCTILPEGYY
ncbi:hypothetical protein DQT32_04555 [Salmonella enterica subsp. enterica serovar Braenderup]|nr:hypothetical protein [Salmonella enterica subsp. enterica serovar Braenderup]